MKSNKSHGLKDKLVPYLLFPAVIGTLTGLLIFLFKVSSSAVMHASERIYAFVRENPIYLPLLIIGAGLIGVCSALILRVAKECRGGGIPTAVASVRGLVPLKWVEGVFALFGSALLTYFAGIPLGNEGPSVQMGAAVGKGGSRIAGKDRLALERYLMTGGASSGFAIATGAPLAGIMFALEEAHRRFSVALFTVASISVLCGVVTQRYLCFFFDVDTTFFDLSISQTLPSRYLWIAIIIGAVCAAVSLLFTRLYRAVGMLSKTKIGKVPFTVKLVIIFVSVSIFGFFSQNFIGTGHSLIESLLHGGGLWYAILLILFVRAMLMIFANNEGVSGGIFVPNLAFGAMIASLIAEGLISLNLIEKQYYVILIVVGMASFLAAASRTPITAIAFSLEALCIASNVFPVILGVVVSYIIAEFSGNSSFTDAVIESRVKKAHRGKDAVIVYSHMTVMAGSFAEGIEIRDILWPPTCAVLSIDRNASPSLNHDGQKLCEGDVLHLHYQTYEPEETLKMLTAILGEQPIDLNMRSHLGSEAHLVPLD